MNCWDEKFKLCEHTEFFLRAKTFDIKVGYVENVIIGHTLARSTEYNKFRARGVSYQKFTAERYGYDKWIKRYRHI
jgi:hypothetical protein